MAGMSNYLESAIVNHIFRGTPYTGPGTLGIALCTVAVVDSDTGALAGKEVVGGSYGRVSITTAGGVEWADVVGGNGTTLNISAIVFPTATAPWGTITHVAICDSATVGAGNLLFHAPLAASKTIPSGDTFTFDVSALAVQIDD